MPIPSHGADALTSRILRSTLGLAAWTAAWVASLALAAFGPELLWNRQPGPTLVAVAVTVLVGVGMLFANKRNLDAMDELQRALQLQAMALTLGAGLVGGLAWTLLARHELVGLRAEIGHLVAFMGVVYMVATLVGSLRYR